jgi:benzoyl-CoA 2,3-dioxygenase component A
VAKVTGNVRVTRSGASSDVHHIILDFGAVPFPVLEGQSIGVVPPGTDANGRPHAMRLYSVCSARDGERPNTNNLALTVKRVAEPRPDGSVFRGVASNWLCDLALGRDGAGDRALRRHLPDAGRRRHGRRHGLHRHRRRALPRLHRAAAPLSGHGRGRLHLFFGARTPEELPYFGRCRRCRPRCWRGSWSSAASRRGEGIRAGPHARARGRDRRAAAQGGGTTHIYVCGLKGLEAGVDAALAAICAEDGLDWPALRETMRAEGRLHVETY